MISSVVILILGFGLPFGYFYLTKNPQFGGKLTKEDKIRLQKSVQWKKGSFQNLSKTTMDINVKSLPGLIKESIGGRRDRNPKENIPIQPFDNQHFHQNDRPRFIWYGHSTLLLRINKKNILIDPMFGPDASPVGPIRTKRFSQQSLNLIQELPQIDLVIMTHDHYDHLDFQSLRLLKDKVNKFLVPLGVERHLIHWGIDKASITEVDWWDQIRLLGLEFICTPSRHFSGRGAFDRAKSLWCGWVIRNEKHSIYWSGDGGYDEHFKAIGEKFGPFDWGFIECGQYNERWHPIHLYPEEAVKAAADARVKMTIPVHWGAFSLALHHWKEPVLRFVKEAEEQNLNYTTPKPGAIVELGFEDSDCWYDSFS